MTTCSEGRAQDVFGPKIHENREWRTLYNKEMLDFYLHLTLSEILRLRWADHIARMEDGWNAFNIWIGKPMDERLLERLGAGGKRILRWILQKKK